MLIDSTALRSSLYDSQAKWGMSTRCHWFKGYKLHLCTTAKGIFYRMYSPPRIGMMLP
ncbi:transposase [Geobacillus stearothermophilus]|nr:transposase [Geobacillus stearothermophilus]MED4357601.1 transposase [Geobacillus stearothermophilus]